MVNTGPETEPQGGAIIALSTSQVMTILKIKSKHTIYKWIMLGRLHPKRRPIGDRLFLEFSDKEVRRLKAKMKETPEPGQSLLK